MITSIMVSRYHFPLKESPLICFPGKELDQMKLGRLETPEGRQLTRRRLLFGSSEGVSWNIHSSSTLVVTKSGIRHEGPWRVTWMNCCFSQRINADKTEPLVTTAAGGMDGTHVMLSDDQTRKAAVYTVPPVQTAGTGRPGLAALKVQQLFGAPAVTGRGWVRGGIPERWRCSPWLVHAPVQFVKIH